MTAADGLQERPRPLGQYGLLIATFGTVFSVGTAAARRQGRLPEQIGAGDIALGALATQKLSRLVTREKVTSAVRAPFTEPAAGNGDGATGPEGDERPAGGGIRYAIGELVTCPFCLAQWIAAAFTLGLLYAPRVTRLVMGMMAMVGLSDFLQVAYKAAENRRG